MPRKKAKSLEKKEAEVLDGYEGWLEKRPVKKAHAKAGSIAEDEK